MIDLFMRHSYARTGGVVVGIYLLSVLLIYGLNWIALHPDLVPASLHGPPLGTPQPADVIVVLAQSAERDAYAESLVTHGLPPRILSTLIDPVCIGKGLPPAECGTGVRNTVDEALVVRRILAREQAQRVMVVTSRSHVVRAAAVFTVVFFGSSVAVDVVGPTDASWPEKLTMRELWSFFPSIAGAVIGRFTPSLYEWISHHLYSCSSLDLPTPEVHS